MPETIETVPEIETANCSQTMPLKDWIGGGTDEECRPCLLAPVVQWYRDELLERGMQEMATEIEQAADKADPAKLAQKLDEVKAAVPEDLRTRLQEFDCAMENYKPEAAVNDETTTGGDNGK